MLSRPRSSFALFGLYDIRPEISTNCRVVDTPGVLSNTRTMPVFCATYQRSVRVGSCSIAIGTENVRFGNTRSTASGNGERGASPARQVVLAGRESSPPVNVVVTFTAADCADSL